MAWKHPQTVGDRHRQPWRGVRLVRLLFLVLRHAWKPALAQRPAVLVLSAIDSADVQTCLSFTRELGCKSSMAFIRDKQTSRRVALGHRPWRDQGTAHARDSKVGQTTPWTTRHDMSLAAGTEIGYGADPSQGHEHTRLRGLGLRVVYLEPATLVSCKREVAVVCAVRRHPRKAKVHAFGSRLRAFWYPVSALFLPYQFRCRSIALLVEWPSLQRLPIQLVTKHANASKNGSHLLRRFHASTLLLLLFVLFRAMVVFPGTKYMSGNRALLET